MQLIAYGKRRLHRWRGSSCTPVVLKICFFLFFSGGIINGAKSQVIELELKNASLEMAFRQVEQQTSYRFVYTKEQLAISVPVTASIKSSDLVQILKTVFRSQPFTYSIDKTYILVKAVDKQNEGLGLTNQSISGKLVTEHGEVISGATVSVKGTTKMMTTDSEGSFSFDEITLPAVLHITGAEFEAQEYIFTTGGFSSVSIRAKINQLDEVIMMAYGETTKKLNTGAISKISAQQISKQPVTNVLAALQGRVPGLLITQTNGYAGGNFSVQIRGQNSLLQGSEPLFVVDGVPITTGNNSVNQLNNAAGQFSPLNLINASEIESVEVLKDADATSIYGSRGANGAILITTKKGVNEKAKIDIRVYQGWSKITRNMPMLNTRQYLEMRRQAFANDGIAPTATNAPDLFILDTTRYTDFRKLLIGNTSQATDAQANYSGGNALVNFRLGAGYHRETTVLPSSLANNKKSINLNVNHTSATKKLQISMSAQFSMSQNNLPVSDLAGMTNVVPHLRLYDSLGNLNWKEGSSTFKDLGVKNPLSLLKTFYTGETENLISSGKFSYQLFKGLEFRTNLGYTQITANERRNDPTTSIDPAQGTTAFAQFSSSRKKSWIIEPQLEYKNSFGKNRVSVLVGMTAQENKSNGITLAGSNYPNDLLLNSINGAGSVTSQTSFNQYKYISAFARCNFNASDRYLLNLTGRYDGSSRFGPDRRFARFGSIGAGWIFSKEKWISGHIPWLSLGKIRSSYGISGNDQIGDYQYLDTWTASGITYQGVPGVTPSRLFNPIYSWEQNKKLEVALELAFIKNRISLTASYYKNRSGNQLVSYTLPYQTGFASIARNIDALIQNEGMEFELTTSLLDGKILTWNTAFNVSIPKNKLINFPGLRTSSYANTYVIGESVNARKRYEYLGVNPATGLYSFRDVDGNGVFNTIDRIKTTSTDPVCFGGFLNSISIAQFRVDFFFEFRKQLGRNYLQDLGVPGYRLVNQPTIVLDRWQKPGDIAKVQKYTSSTTSQAYQLAASTILSSTGYTTDASYIRLKNVSVAYDLPSRILGKMRLTTASIFLQGQNLFVITKFLGSDPESQNTIGMPPLRTISCGFQFTFK